MAERFDPLAAGARKEYALVMTAGNLAVDEGALSGLEYRLSATPSARAPAPSTL
jgi:hypothetical protein